MATWTSSANTDDKMATAEFQSTTMILMMMINNGVLTGFNYTVAMMLVPLYDGLKGWNSSIVHLNNPIFPNGSVNSNDYKIMEMTMMAMAMAIEPSFN